MRAAFEEAYARYSTGTVGTPLQEEYRREYATSSLVTATTLWGAEIQVILPELVSCELHRYGLIEPALTALFIERIGPEAVVFDVGAHLGYYSMLAETLGAEVHAFEPAPETLSALRSNVGDQVRVVAKGAWSADERLELKDFGSDHSAVNTFVSSRDEDLDEPDATHTVPVTSIDSYVSLTRAVPTLVKIDAEGAELEVLRGASRTLEAHAPIVTIEVGDTEDELHSRKTIDFAVHLGYSPFELTVDGVMPHEVRERYGYGNLALIPEEASGP